MPRILIADDHSHIRSMLKVTLEAHAGWDVCAEATNGSEAVQKAAELKPDLIILDLSMPVMGGLQAASQILSVSPNLPIVLFTNHVYSTLASEARKIGIRRVVNKGGDELMNIVEDLLNEKLQSSVDILLANVQSKLGQSSKVAEKRWKETEDL